MKEISFESQVLHTPFEKEDAYHSLSMPVYNTAAYEFDSAEAMEAAFCGRTSDHAYSRITNPTVQYFEKKVCSVTDALSVTALNSGMAAISNTLITVAYAGANIITSSHLFGNTYSFIKNTLGAFGVQARFCDLTNPEEVRSQVDEKTCAIFLEVITNPQLEIADLKKLSAIGKEMGVPLIADTTVVPFNIFKAKDLGWILKLYPVQNIFQVEPQVLADLFSTMEHSTGIILQNYLRWLINLVAEHSLLN
jgi:O-acetylhomoserine sulfhydrylase